MRSNATESKNSEQIYVAVFVLYYILWRLEYIYC